MADTKDLTLVLKAKDLATKATDRLGRSLDGVNKKAQSVGSRLAGLAKTGFKVLGIGALAAAGAIALFTKNAADEEKGIARLNAALKANVKGWKGNTDAIEAVITKREALAFSDDDLRASLTKLVVRTKDVSKALALQATAMDLSRLKGVDLNTATDLLTKGMAGNKKVLEQLGITLPKTATAQERLTAIQKVAAGQAKAYGETAAGAQEAFQIAVDDLTEDLGQTFLPIMKTIFTWLRTTGIPAVRGIIAAIGDWFAKNRPLINQITGFARDVLGFLITQIAKVVGWFGSVLTTLSKNEDVMRVVKGILTGIGVAASFVWQAVQTVVGWFAKAFDVLSRNQDFLRAVKGLWNGLAIVLGAVVGALRLIVHWAGEAIDALGKIKVPHIDLPNINLPHFAAGGWAGLNGPQLAVVGEKEPELIIPRSQLGNTGTGFRIVGISEQNIIDIAERGLFVRLQRAAPTTGPT